MPQKKRNPIAACCSACCGRYRHFADETVFGRAFTNNYGSLFNLIIANALFWAAGLPRMLDCEFEGVRRNVEGNVCNGTKGSGVFVITCILFIVATFLYFYRLIRDFVVEYRYVTKVRERREREDKLAMEQNAEAERLATEEQNRQVQERAREAKRHEADAARTLAHNIAGRSERKEVEMTGMGKTEEKPARAAPSHKGEEASAVAGEPQPESHDQPLLNETSAASPTVQQHEDGAGKKKRRRRKKN